MDKLESGTTQGATTASGNLQGQGDQQTSFDAKAFTDALKTNADLQAAFDEAVARKLQGEKDRRINKTERKLAEIDERLAVYERYRAEGMTPEKARQAMEMDEALEFYRQQKETGMQTPTQGAAGNRGTGEVNALAMEFLKNAGIGEDDPDVVQLLRNTPDNMLAAEAAKLVVRRVSNAPRPGQVIQPSGGNVPAADMMAEYKAKAKQLQPGSHSMLMLRNEYRKRGLNI